MGVQTILIRDESISGETLNSFALDFTAPEVSVADIIRERVRYEVDAYNRKVGQRFAGLIQPTDTEAELNGFKMKKCRKIDARTQIKTALRAFEGNGFILLLDDLQAETLDQRVQLSPDMNISFLKLTPLVGG